MRRGRKGVSSVVGGAIIIAIVFTVIFPLLIYYQNMLSEYNYEVLKKYREEAKKLSERAEVYATLTPTGEIIIMAANKGTLHTTIERIYIINSDGSVKTVLSADITLPAFSDPIYYSTGQTLGSGDEVDVFAISMRGVKIVSPTNPLNTSKPPLIFSVLLKNLKTDRKYEVSLSVNTVKDLSGSNKQVGCIYTGSGCSDAVTQSFINRVPQDTRAVTFPIWPGNYTLMIKEYQWSGSWTQESSITEVVVVMSSMEKVYDFSGSAGLTPPSALKVKLIVPQMLVADKPSGLIKRYGIVSAKMVIYYNRTASEALRNVHYTVSCSGGVTCTIQSVSPSDVDILLPGEQVTVTFVIKYEVTSPDTITMTPSITSAIGEDTGTAYSKTGEAVDVLVCRLDPVVGYKVPVCA